VNELILIIKQHIKQFIRRIDVILQSLDVRKRSVLSKLHFGKSSSSADPISSSL